MAKKFNILVVDDEESIRTLLVRFLSKMHYATGAGTGEQAVELARQQKFDVVFLDMKMPGMDGLDTLRALKKIHPSDCVVIITGYAEDERLSAALKEGAITCLKKPFHIEEIKNIITQNVDGALDVPLKILVVDDEIFRRLFLKLNVEPKYSVSAVRDAREALDSLQAEQYDICFIDIILPGISGFELYDKCREISPQTKIVLFTGSDEKFSNILSKTGEDPSFSLKKPFALDDVVEIINRIESSVDVDSR
ncbi:MAG: response regulator [Candidatus Omnitrophota bacterium]